MDLEDSQRVSAIEQVLGLVLAELDERVPDFVAGLEARADGLPAKVASISRPHINDLLERLAKIRKSPTD